MEIKPEYFARLQVMYARALALSNGDEDRAIRLVSKAADQVALGGTKHDARPAVVRRALGLEAAR